MGKTKYKGIFIMIVFIAVFFLPQMAMSYPTMTIDEGEYHKEIVYGPVDMGEIVKKDLDSKLSALKEEDDNTNDFSSTSLLERAFHRDWLITRSVNYGLSGLDRALDYCSDYTGELTTNIDQLVQEKIAKYEDVGCGLEQNIRAANEAEKKRIKDFTTSLKDAKFLDAISITVDRNGNKTGGNSIYDKVAGISFLLTLLVFACRIFYFVWAMLFQGGGELDELIRSFLWCLFIIILVFSLRSIATYGIIISDLVKYNIIMGSDGTNSFTAVSQLLYMKDMMLGLSDDVGLLAWLSNSASGVLSKLFGSLAYSLSGIVIWLLILLSDMLLAIHIVIGPIVFAISLFPAFEQFRKQWTKGLISLLFWGPLAAIYSYLIMIILVVGLDTSILTFILISIVYLIGATKVPNVAESMSGSVMGAIAAGMAMLPAKVASNVATGGVTGVAGAAKRGIAGR